MELVFHAGIYGPHFREDSQEHQPADPALRFHLLRAVCPGVSNSISLSLHPLHYGYNAGPCSNWL